MLEFITFVLQPVHIYYVWHTEKQHMLSAEKNPDTLRACHAAKQITVTGSAKG